MFSVLRLIALLAVVGGTVAITYFKSSQATSLDTTVGESEEVQQFSEEISPSEKVVRMEEDANAFPDDGETASQTDEVLEDLALDKSLDQ